MAEYAHPEVLVETDWVAQNLEAPNVRYVEVDVDTTAYEQGHIAGAVGWNWKGQLQETLTRDLVNQADFEKLLGQSGIDNNTTVILYGDNNNWFAAWAFWQLKYYGHKDARMMNGGRAKWVAENRPLATQVPSHPQKSYKASSPDLKIRAMRDYVNGLVTGSANIGLVDVRSPREFSGELLAPENIPQEGSQRGGHIPGASNIVWSQAVREDGTFKSADELTQLYQGNGITPDKEIIAYCRIGERSSHSWFVLSKLLGYPKVRNYDGSWTEWGSVVGAPIEKP